MELLIKKAQQKNFTESITRQNMQPYYDRYNIDWDSQLFDKSWLDFDNYEIYNGNYRVGVLRLSQEESFFYIRDIQVLKTVQNNGIGTFILNQVEAMAVESGYSILRLKLFKNNPALNLYQRFGFVIVNRKDYIIGLELVLT